METSKTKTKATTTKNPSDSSIPMATPSSPPGPTREIRAHMPTPTTITVYQAYNSAIATAAVAAQKLSASPSFNPQRMTWIKPSWCWMLYRSGYSYKDANQAHILALEMRVEDWWTLLRMAKLTSGEGRLQADEVRVQWDPERGPRLGRSSVQRSIQVGIPKALVERWVGEMIVGIEDVTERARRLKTVLDEDVKNKLGVEELVEMGLMRREEVLHAPEDVEKILRME